ncbi:transcriptional regulator family: Fungal Specific TF [Penicillium roqueforti]|nr:transcriptional regulator family: Fungal Specific TF [Penicillium roqueforti]KAI3101436.1 transcriptional regulator family: Fungal Specific TF [Penicillium roqueforti]
MASRLAACEACRKAKVACDHKRPACTRCASNDRAGICIYRTTPFKRRRAESSTPLQSPSRLPPAQPSFTPRNNPYPNPGFLGSSSHVAIFNEISPQDYHASDTYQASEDLTMLMQLQSTGENILLIQGADVLRQLFNTFPLAAMKDFVTFWLATGANLALAEPFTEKCTENMTRLFTSFSQEDNWHLAYAQRLTQNSREPLQFDSSSDMESFSAQFLDQKFRWESLGIFLSAVSRAAIAIPFFPPLFKTEKDNFVLRKLSTRLSDLALDIVLSLDCLNDLQLVLQYENFIVHTHVDGDQSYHSWSRLGGVLSSMFALGYHENIEKTKPPIPTFLSELRKAAWATTYSADKNVAIFLGRPPRMSKRFCHFQLPLAPTSSDQVFNASPVEDEVVRWKIDTPICYRAGIRWATLCSGLKEDVLELLRLKQRENFNRKASVIRQKAETQWANLPSQFRLSGPLKECSGDAFERDLIASIRLDQLHVLFLLQLSCLDTLTEPDPCILDISDQILSLVVDTILLRDQLVNSGIGLIWKIAHFGLPATGIILLSMLKEHRTLTEGRSSWSKTILNLGIFVAQVQVGSIVRRGDPNYALISKATQTIERFLDSIQREGIQSPTQLSPQPGENGDWAAFFSQDLCDFETDFWENLAYHPSLLPSDPILPPI